MEISRPALIVEASAMDQLLELLRLLATIPLSLSAAGYSTNNAGCCKHRASADAIGRGNDPLTMDPTRLDRREWSTR